MDGARTTHHVRVAYADTDQGGIVHHSVYLRYLECARIELMREHKFDYRKFETELGQCLVVVEANVRYKLPARFDDMVDVNVWLGVANRAKVRFDSTIMRGDELLIRAEITLACVHLASAKLVSIPPGVIALAAPEIQNKR